VAWSDGRDATWLQVELLLDVCHRSVVVLSHRPVVHPRIDHGRVQTLVAQQLLDGGHATAGIQKLRGAGVAQAVGRFISKDPLSGFVNHPQSLNRWAYVRNSPANWVDPTGLADQGCEYCGPKVDDWFLEEIKLHWDWVARQKHWFDLGTYGTGVQSNNPLWLAERHAEWLNTIKHYLKAIPHKWMNFRNLVPGCPSSASCENSVTLCDTCLERSELGNLLFGLTAKVADIPNWETFLFGYHWAKGLQEPWDQAAAGVGYYFAEYNLRVSDSETMCRIFQSTTGTWTDLFGGRTTYWRWDARVEDRKIRRCKPCQQAIHASTPHTIPTYAGEPAGRHKEAGAPKYIYYTEQIPEGMLDPRLLIMIEMGPAPEDLNPIRLR
jgi:hypothetical protein